jgi:hypothetical protein
LVEHRTCNAGVASSTLASGSRPFSFSTIEERDVFQFSSDELCQFGELRQWFKRLSGLRWETFSDDQFDPLIAQELRLLTKQNGLTLALKLPVTAQRDATAAKAEIASRRLAPISPVWPPYSLPSSVKTMSR